jgi:sterol desaturase/sphingolipid hydroxylase (fatty acid hydroxylase superfamily)
MKKLSLWLARALRVTVFPVSMAYAIAVALALVARGHRGPVVLLAPVLSLAAMIALLERALPYEPRWNHPRDDRATDLAHTASSAVVSAVVQALTLSAAAHFTARLQGFAPLGSLSFVSSLVAVVLLGDLGPYFFHRASHEWSPFLFRVHAVHHGPTRLYWLNAFRVHPINLAANTALRLAPAALLGARPEVILVAGVVNAVANLLAHANVDVALGPLDWVFSGPTLHRVHHHESASISQSNYGATTIVWDVLFRTRASGDVVAVRDGSVGLGGDAPPEGWLAQMAYPFRLRCCDDSPKSEAP